MAGETTSPRRTAVKRTSEAQRRVEAWVSAYTPLPGVHDEFMGPDGLPRPHWLKFLNSLARLEPEEIAQRFAAADRRIHDTGVSYRVFGETSERGWPLGRLPMLIGESEWRDISAGIEQRAELMERILGDLYGDAKLVTEGVLPAAVVAGSPEFLRPMCGVRPSGGRWLNLYAADIGRGPDGNWWVLGDRAQAPSGAGYALENRLVISRAFPNLYRDINVERLAPFFKGFRDGLTAAAERAEPRICLLTPGPYSETYFEQAYLARYLGFLLVEGDDLVMSNGAIHVRTIAGLKRADVIWRRVDADWCDPVELTGASRLGVPGLLEAIRGGSVSVANMPGAGLVESRALLGFMPVLARRLLGEELRLPNIATWWCGQAEEREEVLERLGSLTISGAFSDKVPGFSDRQKIIGSELDSAQLARLDAGIRERGISYVGQEIVQLSTTPLWDDGKLTPKPFVLRVFCAWTPQGWKVMPGGFCRVSDQEDARAVAMGDNVKSADVWVLADKPVEMTTLLPPTDKVKIIRLLGNLPSRAADNMFWFGRYLERAEATLRVIRCLCGRVIDADAPSHSARMSIERLQRMLAAWGAVSKKELDAPASTIALLALQDKDSYGSALSIASSARHAASFIRERLSQDTWQSLARLEEILAAELPRVAPEPATIELVEHALRILASISGLVQENFNRVAGWSFLDLGRRVERGIDTCRFARQFADKDATLDNLDVLLDLIDSQITYRSRYVQGIAPAPVRDMALLDPFNPRSVAFQIARINEHFASLPVLREDGILETPRRLSTRLTADIAIEDADSMDKNRIFAFEQQLMTLAEAIAERYFLRGANAVRGERLKGLA